MANFAIVGDPLWIVHDDPTTIAIRDDNVKRKFAVYECDKLVCGGLSREQADSVCDAHNKYLDVIYMPTMYDESQFIRRINTLANWTGFDKMIEDGENCNE